MTHINIQAHTLVYPHEQLQDFVLHSKMVIFQIFPERDPHIVLELLPRLDLLILNNFQYTIMDEYMHQLLVNAIVVKDHRVLISQRSLEEKHEPDKWTIPGGKVEKSSNELWNILEMNVKKEVLEETGVEIENEMKLIANNSFIKKDSTHVVAMIFLTKWKANEAKALDDTIDVKWITKEELGSYEFPPNVKEYIEKGFEEIEK